MTAAPNEREEGALDRQSVGDEESVAERAAEMDGGRLSLLEKIGEGGMGVVWLARDNGLHRLVAIKRPQGAMFQTEQGCRRFLREARSAARLSHPNIVSVYRVDQDAEGPYIEMEYVQGHSLAVEVREHGAGLPIDRVSRIALQLCEAMVCAHDCGIVHRDIKPSNVLIGPRGDAKLVDFGLAAAHDKRVDVSETLTATGTMLGTLFYAAPEQVENAALADERSDIYSLAATLFHALTGRSPRNLRFDLLPKLVRPVLERALEELPENRHGSMAEFAAAWRESAEKAERRFTLDDARCPKCHEENPITARFCLHCGENLSGLFKPCPKCEALYRVDQEYCASCGAHIPSESLLKQIVDAEKEYDYETIKRTSEKGISYFPTIVLFQEKLEFANWWLAEMERLKQAIEQANNDSERMRLMGELLELHPTHEGYKTWRERLQRECMELEERIRKAEGDFEYTTALELSELGSRRFPDNMFFEGKSKWAEVRVKETNSLILQLAKIGMDPGRVGLLEKLLVLNPANKEYLRQIDVLRGETLLREKEEQGCYEECISILETMLKNYPKEPLFQQRLSGFTSKLSYYRQVQERIAGLEESLKKGMVHSILGSSLELQRLLPRAPDLEWLVRKAKARFWLSFLFLAISILAVLLAPPIAYGISYRNQPRTKQEKYGCFSQRTIARSSDEIENSASGVAILVTIGMLGVLTASVVGVKTWNSLDSSIRMLDWMPVQVRSTWMGKILVSLRVESDARKKEKKLKESAERQADRARRRARRR